MKLDIRYLYALYSHQYPLRVKIGISDSPLRRAREVKSELQAYKGNVRVYVALAMPLLMARTQESTLHRKLAFLAAPMPSHSGKTEWFYHANFITCGVLCLVGWWFGVKPEFSIYAALSVLTGWLFPADAALLVLAVFLWEVRWLAVGVMIAVIYFT